MDSSNRSRISEETRVFSLLRTLDTQIRQTGTFGVSVEEACHYLHISLVDGYRILYKIAPEFSGYVSDHFGPDSINELAGLIDELSDFDAQRVFHNAGAILDRESISELAALYVDTVNSALMSHPPQAAEFLQMRQHFKTPRRAFEVYLDHFFDAGALFEKTITAFLTAHRYELPDFARFTARRCLSLFFERHILSFESLCEPLFDRLTGGKTAGRPQDANPHALRTLGLDTLPSDRQTLRLHYKTLMKTFHPDVNPHGLEMSKKINSAYAQLLTHFS